MTDIDSRDRSLGFADDMPELLTVDSFLASNLTPLLIGPRAGRYLRVFGRLRDRRARTPERIAGGGSWNWAAFLVAPLWALHRRLYGLGALLFLLDLVLIALWLPGADAATAGALRGLSLLGAALGAFIAGRRGDGLYFAAVYRRWQILRDAPWAVQERLARRFGGTAPLLSGLALLSLASCAALVVLAGE